MTDREQTNEQGRTLLWALEKHGGDPDAARAMLTSGRDADDHDMSQDLAPHGWPKLVVWETIYENDEGDLWRIETPEQRYVRVLKWVEDWLIEPGATTPTQRSA